jgi:hypothetical protein
MYHFKKKNRKYTLQEVILKGKRKIKEASNAPFPLISIKNHIISSSSSEKMHRYY